MAYMDLFLSNQQYQLTPDQQQNAQAAGWLGAASNLANMSAPHPGAMATPLQLLTGGLSGLKSGSQDYLSDFYNQQMQQANLRKTQAEAALTSGKADFAGGGSGMPLLQSFYQQPAGATPPPVQPAPMMAQGGVAPPPSAPQLAAQGAPQGSPQIPPINASQLQPPQGAAPQGSPQGSITAMGTDVPTQARILYTRGQQAFNLGIPGGSDMIKMAIEMDPSIVYEKALANSQGQAQGALPSDLTKIAATGAQTRLSDTHAAGLRPHDQAVMIGGKMYTIPSNDAAASQGAVPSNLGVPDGTPVSTAIPAGAKNLAEAQAADLAAAQKTAVNFDARMKSAQDTLQKALEVSDAAPSGYFVEQKRDLDNQLAATGIPFTNLHLSGGASSRAHDMLQNLNSNLLTQEIPALAQGAGGRIDIPLVNAAKEASQLPMDAAPQTKKAVIQNLLDNLRRVQNNYHNAVNQSNDFTGGATPSMGNTAGWSAKRVQ